MHVQRIKDYRVLLMLLEFGYLTLGRSSRSRIDL